MIKLFISLTVALFILYMIIARLLKDKKGWKEKEPEFRRLIEEDILKQKIELSITVNACETIDFREGDFSLWIAATSDYIAYIVKEAVARNDSGDICLSKISEASIRKLKSQYYYELQVIEEKTQEAKKLVILLNKKQHESLSQYIKDISDN